MSLSAIPTTPVNSYPTAPISAPSPASSTSNSPPTSGAPDRPNDGDADDKSSVFALGVTIDNYIYILHMLYKPPQLSRPRKRVRKRRLKP